MKKQYTVTWKGHHHDYSSELTGTLEWLTRAFGYTLMVGNSMDRKIPTNPKTIKSLVNALNKSESLRYNGYDPYYYELKGE